MILLIDNTDSFTYNVAHALGRLGQTVRVIRSNVLTLADIEKLAPSAIVISPGPGRPEDAGISLKAVERFAGRVPILGVCLGHQCIGQVFGARVVRGGEPVHGKTSEIDHDGQTIFRNMPRPFTACRYHSLVVTAESVAPPLTVTATTADGTVMAVRVPELMVEGVQFHPESVATPQGTTVFVNFIDRYLVDPETARAA